MDSSHRPGQSGVSEELNRQFKSLLPVTCSGKMEAAYSATSEKSPGTSTLSKFDRY
jgi:hypothetical protein